MKYSNDLRKKVIDLVQNGEEQKKVAALLRIDKSTVYRWCKRYKETGATTPKDYHRNNDKIKVDLLKIESIVQNNPLLTLSEIATKVGNVTHVTVFYCIKKLGYTFKKSHGYIKSETKKKEESL